MRKILTVVGATALAGSLAVAAWPSGAADHLEAPLVKTDGRTDITDVYAFKHGANTVLIMDVNPLAGVVSGTTFDPKGTYQLGIDNDGDAEFDVTLDVTFGSPKKDDEQKVKVKLDGHTVGIGSTEAVVDLRGGGKVFAGLRDDPFFFDLAAFLDQVKGGSGGRTFCDANATDFFKGTNVSAIVLEVPSAWLTGAGNPNIGIDARTFHRKEMRDQMGRPAINTVFTPANLKDAFNATAPVDMFDRFGQIFIDDLKALGGYSDAQATALTHVLLPDLLTVDTSSNAGFLNGRKLADDVIDIELNLVTQGGIATDCVNGNDKAFSNSFPYLAAPHSS
jgi:hypothetical protein